MCSIVDRVLHSTEAHSLYTKVVEASRDRPATPADAIADHGAMLGSSFGASAIVAYSLTGITAARVAAQRSSLPRLAARLRAVVQN